jgi:hypothetical protein
MHRTAEGQRTFHAVDRRRDRRNGDDTLRAIRVRIMSIYYTKRKKYDGKRTHDRQTATTQVVTGGLTRYCVIVFGGILNYNLLAPD